MSWKTLVAMLAITIVSSLACSQVAYCQCGNQQRQVQQQVAAPILSLPSTSPVQTSQSVSLPAVAPQALFAQPSTCTACQQRQNITEKQVTTIPQQQIASQAVTLQPQLIQQSSTAQALTSQCSSSGGGLLSKLRLRDKAKPSATTVTQITKVRQPRL